MSWRAWCGVGAVLYVGGLGAVAHWRDIVVVVYVGVLVYVVWCRCRAVWGSVSSVVY